MALDPITAGLDTATAIINKVWPDKTEAEKAQIAAVVQLAASQTDVDKAEADSSDPWQHWRGGLGWVCVMGYFWDFVAQPLISTIGAALGRTITLVPLDIGQLSTLTLGMLGLGAMHVVGQINGVK